MSTRNLLLVCLVAAAAGAALAVSRQSEFPAELTNSAAIDALLHAERHVEVDNAVPFHFNVHVDDDFDEVSFIAESMTVKQRATAAAAEPAAADEEPPVLCETVCRPMNDTDMDMATAAARYAAKASNPEGKPAVKATVKSADAATLEMSFLEMKRDICHAKGGNWNQDASECDPFMKITSKAVQFDAETLFNMCQMEHGEHYMPCNPYQALALAHLFNVPDHAYYWLWPGGRFDQVRQAAFKQDVGHNPRDGMDTCPPRHHLGFFHNWDEAHVDSWGCLPDVNELPVLCCRRG